MNKILWMFRKLTAWGNPYELRDLNERGRKNLGFWESYGW